MKHIELIKRVAQALDNGIFWLRGISGRRYAFRLYAGRTAVTSILPDGTEGEARALEDVNDDFTGEHVRAELDALIRTLEEAEACTTAQAAAARAVLRETTVSVCYTTSNLGYVIVEHVVTAKMRSVLETALGVEVVERNLSLLNGKVLPVRVRDLDNAAKLDAAVLDAMVTGPFRPTTREKMVEMMHTYFTAMHTYFTAVVLGPQ